MRYSLTFCSVRSSATCLLIATVIAGSALCLLLDRQDDGLPFLVKGEDAILSEIASMELERPSEAKPQTALGNAWWRLADAARVPAHAESARMRACVW